VDSALTDFFSAVSTADSAVFQQYILLTAILSSNQLLKLSIGKLSLQ
jgi:hypothetical protein